MRLISTLELADEHESRFPEAKLARVSAVCKLLTSQIHRERCEHTGRFVLHAAQAQVAAVCEQS